MALFGLLVLGLCVAFPGHALDLVAFVGIAGPLTSALAQIAALGPGIKALVGFVGFVVALISLSALRNFGPVLFYVGLAIFARRGPGDRRRDHGRGHLNAAASTHPGGRMQADTYIPRRLDDQWKIGFWDVDVAVPFLFALFVGYMSGSKVVLRALHRDGLLTSRWISRIKADKHPAFAMHWLYWHLPTSPLTAMRATPPSHIRRMVG